MASRLQLLLPIRDVFPMKISTTLARLVWASAHINVFGACRKIQDGVGEANALVLIAYGEICAQELVTPYLGTQTNVTQPL
jgi:hypothetical protein